MNLCFRDIVVMYDSSSCSYTAALDLKGATANAGIATGVAITSSSVKQESWSYRSLACGSTFQQLKQSVEKAKQALADRGGYLAGAFPSSSRVNSSSICSVTSLTGKF